MKKIKIHKILNHEKKIGVDKIYFYKNFSKKCGKIVKKNKKNNQSFIKK